MPRLRARLVLLWAVSAVLATVLPLALAAWGDGASWLGSTYQKRLELELFGLTGSVFLAVVVLSLWRLGGPDFRRDPMPLLAVLLVGSLLLILVSELSPVSIDYRNYQQAARAVVEGGSLYEKTGYVYPPLFAEVLAVTFLAVHNLFDTQLGEHRSWQIVFYLYQSGQFFLAFAAFGLCWVICRRFTSDLRLLTALLTVLFLVNVPLLRTVCFNQINLLLLVVVLGGIVLMARLPVLAGVVLAVGVHLKLYPTLLALPLLVARRVRTVVGLVLGGVGIVVAQVSLGEASAWQQFLEYSKNPSTGTALRDNSIHSLLYNTDRVLGLDAGAAVDGLYLAFVAVGLGLLAWRLWQRLDGDVSPLAEPQPMTFMMLETLAFTLLISPMLWEHHFVLLLPFAAVTFLQQPADKRATTVLWLALIFAVPTFDLYPLSYHRLLGLVGLLVLSDPRRTAAATRSMPEHSRS